MEEKRSSLVEENRPLSRRAFLGKIAIASMGGAGVIALAGSLNLSIPRVILETTRFKAGKVTNFPLHVYTFLRDKNVFVYRDRTKIQALSAVCTHLGCIVNKLENGFECPCHGSRYDSDGMVLSGPAPRPLDWLKVELAADGQLIIDTGKKVSPEDGLLI